MNILNRFKECTYNVGFVEKRIEDILVSGIGKNDIMWMKHNYRDRFFADPFLIKEDKTFFFVLCEEYIFKKRVGTIVLLTVSKKEYKLINRKVLIEENHHLSFPYCELNGQWVVPEACWSGKAFAYQFDMDEMTIKKKIQIADEGLVDNIFYEDSNKIIWLYAGTTKCANSVLYEYKIDEKKSFVRVTQDPVESGWDRSRSAGMLFECAGKLYRPVQDCKERYGKRISIMEVLSIGEDGYKVHECRKIDSSENPIYNETMHTFNVYEDIILVDGSKDVLYFSLTFFIKRIIKKIWSCISSVCRRKRNCDLNMKVKDV